MLRAFVSGNLKKIAIRPLLMALEIEFFSLAVSHFFPKVQLI